MSVRMQGGTEEPMTKPVDLEALQAALDAATPGPWTRESDWVEATDSHGFVRPGRANGRLILDAVSALPALLAELKEARRVVAAVAKKPLVETDNDMGAISFFCLMCGARLAQEGVSLAKNHEASHAPDCAWVAARKLRGEW